MRMKNGGKTQQIIIAIDGPAATGKSTVAKKVAQICDYQYVNSGEFYRAYTYLIISLGLDFSDQDTLEKEIDLTDITFYIDKDRNIIFHYNNTVLAKELYTPSVNELVTKVASLGFIRAKVNHHLKTITDESHSVVEGRDIGTKVFPDSKYKFFIDADPVIRQQRRKNQGIIEDVIARDSNDRARAESPLIMSDDAFYIDSSHLKIDEVVDIFVKRIRITANKLS
jgi:cytidylate kinase